MNGADRSRRRVDETPLAEVRDLVVEFTRGRRQQPLRAVDGVSLAVAPRETVGLVGESGSGKSTIARAILGLTSVTEGSVFFDGADITDASRRERRALSGSLQAVFQDPYSSLNPTRTIGQTLAEMLRGRGDREEASSTKTRVATMLERVGLPVEAADRYPAHFSGGQRQRIAIARALMVRPRLVICDEPVSALDVSVQAQVLNLLDDLQHEFGLAYLFVSHDLAVVRHLSHRIIVLYRGRILEEGPARSIYERPKHPYTKALLSAAPIPDPEVQRRRRSGAMARQGQLARNTHKGEGCVFAPRCAHAVHICRTRQPYLEPTPNGSRVACHRWQELDRDRAPQPADERKNAQTTR
jgi:oligopeptide/dipeptide ABC transporter ATP-binding protein